MWWDCFFWIHRFGFCVNKKAASRTSRWYLVTCRKNSKRCVIVPPCTVNISRQMTRNSWLVIANRSSWGRIWKWWLHGNGCWWCIYTCTCILAFSWSHFTTGQASGVRRSQCGSAWRQGFRRSTTFWPRHFGFWCKKVNRYMLFYPGVQTLKSFTNIPAPTMPAFKLINYMTSKQRPLFNAVQ